MADIKDQLIKDSYNYILQSDLTTGVVYRIGGSIPVNPIFSSGLTVNSGFTYTNGSEQPGYVLTTDGTGYAYWSSVSGTSGNILYITGTGVNSTVRCGVNNTASGNYAASLGGLNNSASGYYSFVGGGLSGNTSGPYSSVIGGFRNTSSGYYSVVGGGVGNTASALYSPAILGGVGNYISENQSFIGGGVTNVIGGNSSTYSVYYTSSAYNRVIVLGDITSTYSVGNTIQFYNHIDNKFIKGNITSSTYSGGYTCLDINTPIGTDIYSGVIINTSTITENNTQLYSGIVGGIGNNITQSGYYGFIGGGVLNKIQ